MLYRVRIDGLSPVIMHSARGIDPLLAINLEKQEIVRKRGTNRTTADDARLRELDAVSSLWLDESDRPTIPPSAIRAVTEGAARKFKQGPLVREGLAVLPDVAFEYDEERYGTTIGELQVSTQFSVPVVVQRNRVIRTRAKFDLPWACEFGLDTDPNLVDLEFLRNWLEIAGTRIGLGDWRPEKSGTYGRFEVAWIKEQES